LKKGDGVIVVFMSSYRGRGTDFDALTHQVKGARSVGEIDIRRCVGQAVILDFSYK